MNAIRMTRSAILGLAMASLVAGSAFAAYDEDDRERLSDKEIEQQLDVVVAPFKKDGRSGTVFEFNPVSIPNLRCVVFSFGSAGGMQCFPRPDRPDKPSGN